MNEHECQFHGKRPPWTCPVCGKVWVLSGDGPGEYWQPREEREREQKAAEAIKRELGF